MELTESTLDRVVREALAEDLGELGDRTSEGLFDESLTCHARVLVKDPGVVCGLDAVAAVYAARDSEVRVEPVVAEGTAVTSPPVIVAAIEGPARAVLAGERTALNLLARMSGIATLARHYVQAVQGTGATILDTRKTTPGLRALEKRAVACGGATNHRLGLYDAILVKDNHLRLCADLREAIGRLRAAGSGLPVEVECDTLDQVAAALAGGADRILLDNMSLAHLRQAVALVAGRVPLEASGGITLDTVRAVAQTGVDLISVGALTHSARSLDVSLEVSP